MPIKFDIQIDGGLQKFDRIIKNELDGVKNFKWLFEMIIDYLEGKQTYLKVNSPINRIYESNGSLIGGDWSLRDMMYAEWKSKHWQEARQHEVGFSNNQLQVLTGATLHSLLFGDDENAVRIINENSMEYGTKVDYARGNQERHHILDFFPDMINEFNNIIALYINGLGDLSIDVQNMMVKSI